jgi:hypothetical protein
MDFRAASLVSNSLDEVLASTSTTRTNANQDQITQRITEQFGDALDTTVEHWETVHGDLHWSNLVGPQFGLLDWELWGKVHKGQILQPCSVTAFWSLLMPRSCASGSVTCSTHRLAGSRGCTSSRGFDDAFTAVTILTSPTLSMHIRASC